MNQLRTTLQVYNILKTSETMRLCTTSASRTGTSISALIISIFSLPETKEIFPVHLLYIHQIKPQHFCRVLLHKNDIRFSNSKDDKYEKRFANFLKFGNLVVLLRFALGKEFVEKLVEIEEMYTQLFLFKIRFGSTKKLENFVVSLAIKRCPDVFRIRKLTLITCNGTNIDTFLNFITLLC